MKYIDRYKIPTYAVCAVEYGDFSGLEEEDIKNVKEFLRKEFPKGFVTDYQNESYFSTVPAFGKACEVIDVDFYEP